jgi:hypothetical protein
MTFKKGDRVVLRFGEGSYRDEAARRVNYRFKGPAGVPEGTLGTVQKHSSRLSPYSGKKFGNVQVRWDNGKLNWASPDQLSAANPLDDEGGSVLLFGVGVVLLGALGYFVYRQQGPNPLFTLGAG